MAVAIGNISTPKYTSVNGTGVTITSNSITSTSGNALFVFASMGGGGTVAMNSASDSKGNTVTLDSHPTAVGGLDVATGSSPNITGGASHTGSMSVTATGGGDTQCIIAEFSGLATTSILDGTPVTNNGTGTAVTAGSMTAATAGSLYLGVETSAGSPTITPDGSWNQIQEQESGSSNQPISIIYQVTSGAQNPSWTLGASNNWIAGGAIYKVAGGAVATGFGVPPANTFHPGNSPGGFTRFQASRQYAQVISTVFRRTLSGFGSRTGSRQPHGH